MSVEKNNEQDLIRSAEEAALSLPEEHGPTSPGCTQDDDCVLQKFRLYETRSVINSQSLHFASFIFVNEFYLEFLWMNKYYVSLFTILTLFLIALAHCIKIILLTII